jgi:hypothetical protein
MKTSISLNATMLSAIIFFSYHSCLFAQTNLVPNPSFEEYDICPDDQGQVYRAKHWNSFGNSPDYFNSCASEISGVSVPQNVWGFQYANTGNAYTGIAAVDIDTTIEVREFIGTKLITPLNHGQKYYVSFYVSRQNISTVAVDKVGVLFSKTSYAVDSFCTAPCSLSNFSQSNISHVYSHKIIDDTLNWTNINGSFVADSSYEYMIIGIFFTNQNLNYVITDSTKLYRAVWYYIDDVYVGTDSITSVSENNIPNKYLKIFPNPVNNNMVSISLSSQVNQKQINEFLLLDIFGRELMKYHFNGNNTDVFLNNFSSGIYFVKIKTEEKYFINKIIINNQNQRR